MTKIGLVGGGAREHAIGEALHRSGSEVVTYSSNRNPGLDKISLKSTRIGEAQVEEIAELMEKDGIDIAVIGPEKPLVSGITDCLRRKGIAAFGPDRKGAMIEGSKLFARELLEKYRIEGNVRYMHVKDGSMVERAVEQWNGEFAIKPVGLTGGKGVKVMGDHFSSRAEAAEYGRRLLEESSEGFIIEEKLYGEEFTFQAVVSRNRIFPLPLVQDHKRLLEGDLGPNTGGMGSYTMPDGRLPFISQESYSRALDIMRKTLKALGKENINYTGILYGGFMETATGPRLLEYNCRFGDPEGTNIMSVMRSSFTDAVVKAVNGDLQEMDLAFHPYATVCRYIVPSGYGSAPASGKVITIDRSIFSIPQLKLYYASVSGSDERIVTTASRALAVVAYDPSLERAEQICTEGIEKISGDIYVRRDIGRKEYIEKKIMKMEGLVQSTHQSHVPR